MHKICKFFTGLAFLIGSCSSFAEEGIVTKVYLTAPEGVGTYVGMVTFRDSPYGLLILPNLYRLPSGLHGFHFHQHPSCDHQGDDAMGHLDPEKNNKHLGPYTDKGHLGDLPPLVVYANGRATLPLLAPRLKIADIQGHALMIHEGSDNYSDKPKKLGGSGARLACGVVMLD